jgi:hypothetical protein
MVGQNHANKRVIAKIVFLNGLWVKCKNPGGCRSFLLTLYIQYTGLNLTKLQTLFPFVWWI